LCLMCGEIVCAANSCCRSSEGVGECSEHANDCGSGIFLVLKMNLLLLIRDHKHSLIATPYLDEHGEEDPYLKRGRPLYLNKERYRQLQQLVMLHHMEWDPRVIASTSTEDASWY